MSDVVQHAVPSVQIVGSLVRSAGLISDVSAAAAARHELTVQQATLLCAIAGRSSTTMAELGGLLRISRSSTTELVDRAEQAGIVTRVADVSDRRQQVLHLTERGDRLGQSYRQTVSEQVAVLLETLTQDQRELLGSLTARVVDANQARATWPVPVEAA